ncbi:unnamed protein product [Cuscuta campestris]|uniref:Myb-like domain-containing protein n=1 Tax=Cuscuta campestris TaxID=132261 RepID=A0A484N3J3_9ASTE|nr:unnamed protein product [Cuscuta campestris]
MDAKDDDATSMMEHSKKRSKRSNKSKENNNMKNGLHNQEKLEGHNIFEEGHATESRDWLEDVEEKKMEVRVADEENVQGPDFLEEGSFTKRRERTEDFENKKEKKRKRYVKCNVIESHPGDECIEGCTEMARTKKKKKKEEKRKKKCDVCVGSKDIGSESLATIESENISRRKMAGNVPKDTKSQKNLEVFPDCGDVLDKGEQKINKVELVQGKRFSKEEDDIIKEAVYKFVERHDLGDEGLDMVFNTRSFTNLRGCLSEIGAAIPYRPNKSVYMRAVKIFRKSESPLTEEEYEFVKEYQERHGNRWADMAKKLGKFGGHVFNAWVRRRLPNMKRGRWSQEEYKTLFDLVNIDLQLKVYQDKKTNHGMLRDNISWTAISNKLGTRNLPTCCRKWYHQLTSPMVMEGKWADSDDYRLIGALYDLDASCMENVDWDNLLDHRSGEVSLQRWKQMVRHIGHYENKSFAEQVEVLASRYCPYLLEARDAWDNKPLVP